MRKRNVVLSWLVGIIITVLLALLGTSFALIWGRVCAASMPNSIITNLWRTVRDNHLAKAVMFFYDRCRCMMHFATRFMMQMEH